MSCSGRTTMVALSLAASVATSIARSTFERTAPTVVLTFATAMRMSLMADSLGRVDDDRAHSGGLWRQKARFDDVRDGPVATVKAGHFDDIVASLGVGGNAAVLNDGAFTRIVRRDSEVEVAVEDVGEQA